MSKAHSFVLYFVLCDHPDHVLRVNGRWSLSLCECFNAEIGAFYFGSRWLEVVLRRDTLHCSAIRGSRAFEVRKEGLARVNGGAC
jgi:hypothetical protein